MGTESHGSDWICLTPSSRLLLRFLKLRFSKTADLPSVLSLTSQEAVLFMKGGETDRAKRRQEGTVEEPALRV